MNINGIPGQVGVRGLQDTVRPRVEQDRPNAPSAPAPGLANVQGTQAPARPQAALPAEPPPGTDPELWSILSAEERVYFAKVGAMGPLTYGRISTQMQAQPPVARGGRLNVKA